MNNEPTKIVGSRLKDSDVKRPRPPMIGPVVIKGWVAAPIDKMRPVDVKKKYGRRRSRWGPRKAANPAPAAKPSQTRGKISGKHVPPDEADAEAARIVARIDAYRNEHQCSQRDALDALYLELGHSSSVALKQALQRARKRLGRK